MGFRDSFTLSQRVLLAVHTFGLQFELYIIDMAIHWRLLSWLILHWAANHNLDTKEKVN